ncbi:MAG: hypothetical protein IJ053_03655 [Lachnospiraceae bacterium]|nr:hypothetical protein [Lachnospiraceae bacterium]
MKNTDYIKRIILIFAFIFSISTFTACNSKNEEVDNDAVTENEVSTTEAVDETEDTTEEISNNEVIVSEQINELFPDSEFIYYENTEALQPYLDAADARREEIRNSKTEIIQSDEFIPGETYTGTAYYFSPNGDDNNDGLTPDTPKQNVYLLNDWKYDGTLKEGDAVFFERSQEYRLTEGSIDVTSYVTYSAYGEGRKPIFNCSMDNSAEEDLWELYYEGDDGNKIWKYSKELQDVGGIVFDDESYAKRIYEWPTPDGWLALDVVDRDPSRGNEGIYATINTDLFSTGEYRSVEDNLPEDMTYISRVDIGDCEYPINFAGGYYDEDLIGDLYLRCDAGNPGILFDDIEILSNPYGTNGNAFGTWECNGFVLDNLCIKYSLGPIDGWAEGTDIVIQNCEIGWQGSKLHEIPSDEPNIDYFLIGDGIYNVARNAVIRNNYMYQCAEGCTFEQSQGEIADMGNYTCTGNLMEKCGEGIRISWEDADIFDTITLQDNIIVDCGYGFSNNDTEGYFSIDLGWSDVQYAKEFNISDNVCIRGKFGMVIMPANLETNFHDNVFIQDSDGAICILGHEETGQGDWFMMQGN